MGPNLKIRTVLLNNLLDFPQVPLETLKASGVGKSVNRLLQHPKELSDNKKKCKILVRRYSKQIFGIVDTGAVSKEERQMRDIDSLRKYGPSKKTKYQKLKEKQLSEASKKKVHEKGFMPRARVPMPSNRDYLIRPKSNINPDEWSGVLKNRKQTKSGNELLMDKTKKRLLDSKSKKKMQRGAHVNLSGGKGGM